MKRLKQIEETKEMITSAMLKLLQHKDLEEITIKELCYEAKISRISFYRHFECKEDVLLYIFYTGTQKMSKKLKENSKVTIKELIYNRFDLFRNSPHTETLYKHGYLNKLFDRCGLEFYYSEEMCFEGFDDIYLRSFIVGGIEKITSDWIREGMEDGVEEVVIEFITRLTSK